MADTQPEADPGEGAVPAVEVAQAAEGDPAGAAAPAGADDPIVIHAHIMRKLGAMMCQKRTATSCGFWNWSPSLESPPIQRNLSLLPEILDLGGPPSQWRL